MSLTAINLSEKCQAAQLGYPYAIELQLRHWKRNATYQSHLTYAGNVMVHLQEDLTIKYGKSYQAHWKRPNRKAKWYIDQRFTFIRFCFQTEKHRTLALLSI